MILNRLDDPRDNLQRARRLELVRFARSNGQIDITEAMPADIIRKLLRSRGLTKISIPHRVLGSMAQERTLPPGVAPGPAVAKANGAPEKIVEVDADDDLMRQYQQSKPAIPKRGRPQLEVNRLRDECRALGIKLSRRDNMNDMREKIKAHGKQDAS